MSLTVVATLSCDHCPATLVADESPLHARNVALTARGLGWRNGHDGDACPECWEQIMNPHGVQGVLGATA